MILYGCIVSVMYGRLVHMRYGRGKIIAVTTEHKTIDKLMFLDLAK